MGEPQDEALASYAAPFTPEERRLDWSWPVDLLRRRVLALSLFHPEARATIDGRTYAIHRLTPCSGPTLASPGTVLRRVGDRFTLAVGDGVVEVVASERSTEEQLAQPAPGAERWVS